MKHLTLIAISCAIVSAVQCGWSQQPKATAPSQDPQTNMQAFRPSAGSLTTFGYDDPQKIGEVSLEIREITDLKGAAFRGLQVSISKPDYHSEEAVVDADEIPELLKGIDALLEVQSNPTKLKYFQVEYRTKGDLKFVAFNDAKGVMSYSLSARPDFNYFIDANALRRLHSAFSDAHLKLSFMAGAK